MARPLEGYEMTGEFGTSSSLRPEAYKEGREGSRTSCKTKRRRGNSGKTIRAGPLAPPVCEQRPELFNNSPSAGRGNDRTSRTQNTGTETQQAGWSEIATVIIRGVFCRKAVEVGGSHVWQPRGSCHAARLPSRARTRGGLTLQGGIRRFAIRKLIPLS